MSATSGPNDSDPLTEAYHVLGQLNDGADASEAELRTLRDQCAQRSIEHRLAFRAP